MEMFLTSNHTLVQKVEIVPAIADHDIMIADVNVKPQIAQQKPRSVPLYRKAYWDSFRKYISEFASDFMLNYENKSRAVFKSNFGLCEEKRKNEKSVHQKINLQNPCQTSG